MIFWTATTTISAAIIYDRREKRRATARWAHTVSHLAREPVSSTSALPRKLTIYLSAAPGDGLRVAQDHFVEYVRPVLAASGLDWDFVQGRREGDVRAAVAEKLRRVRRAWEKDLRGEDGDSVAATEELPTDEDLIQSVRRRNKIAEYDGVLGDVVIGRNTWKEYIRGLHEGWLGPLAAPPEPEPSPITRSEGESDPKKEETNKPNGPPQPRPHNTPDDYPASPLPLLIPAELAPSIPIPFPHILGFLNTPTRMVRFFNRRALADKIGRDVAAVCLCTYREFRELPDEASASLSETPYEQQKALDWEEKDWVKSVWKETGAKAVPPENYGEGPVTAAKEAKERIWARPVVVDSRIAMRMRRFELQPDDEARARAIIIPEAEVEGWIKGQLRCLYRWGVKKISKEEKLAISLDGDSD
jgi:import inner membrane translocase subunit TIM54